ncbi:T9SS type A sorting domain-containing protein [candidate division KSB1 bacterium]|nr:T9SS type A sorting domain-containing protein [candidate division KSB1 bacterium]
MSGSCLKCLKTFIPFKVSYILFTTILILLLSEHTHAQTLAFPGAEGHGRHTIGGRGGAVYEVTNLNDSGPGSLREAVEARGPRTVVFRVSGTIKLLSDLKIKYSNITIAGQTAPGDGICLRDQTLFVNADEVIIRYLRCRLGDESLAEDDATWGRYCKKVIIDHCSASWSIDEAFSYYGIDSLTVQWCLIAESLYMSHHSKGAHGYGGIWGGKNATFHHNLLAHHSSRNPRFAGGETPACVNVDFRNNVIYNWGFNSAYGGEGGQINMVANYFKAGPATKSSVKYRIVQPSDRYGKWYIEDNFVEGSPEVSANNWAGGVQGSYSAESLIRAYSPFPYEPVTTHTAQHAYEVILDQVGANLPVQDMVDQRIIQEVRTGTATYDGHAYELSHGFSDTSVTRGIIDSQNDVGGWPEYISTEAPADTDHDGMPDEWETANGLDLNDPEDRNQLSANGYTMLEVYLNSLVPNSVSVVAYHEQVPMTFTLHQNYPNPFNQGTMIYYSVPETGLVTIQIFNLNGRLLRNLVSDVRPAGSSFVHWNGTDDKACPVASGLYFGVMKYKDQRKIIKMQFIK